MFIEFERPRHGNIIVNRDAIKGIQQESNGGASILIEGHGWVPLMETYTQVGSMVGDVTWRR